MTEKYPVLPEEDDYAKYPAPVAENDDYAKYPVQPQEPAGNTPAAARQQPPAPKQQSSLRSVKLMLGLVLLLILAIAAYVLLRYFGVIDTTREGQHAVRSYRAPVQNTYSSEPDIPSAAVDQSSFVNASNVNAGDYVIRTFSDGTCEITKYNGSRPNLSIPKQLNGYAVTAIGQYAFSNNKTIENVSIQTSVTKIGASAFSSCTALGIVYLPSTLTTIDDSAFSSCSSLHTIRLPEGLTSIGDWAFSRCESLTSIRIPSTVTAIGDCAFNSCSSMQSYTVEYGNTRYSSLQNCLMTSNNTVLLQYPIGRSDKSFTVPASVEQICINAFTTAKLTSVTIPANKAVSIGDFAFSWCMNLQEIRLPANVASISESAFTGTLDVTLYVERSSYAERFAKQAGMDYAYLP